MKSKWVLFPLGYFKAQLEGFHRLGSDFTEHLTHLSNFLLGHVGYHGSRAFSRFTVDTCGGGGVIWCMLLLIIEVGHGRSQSPGKHGLLRLIL